MSLTPDELRALSPLEVELNTVLQTAARIVGQINNRGGRVTMQMWDENRPGSTVRGVLQPSIMRASVRG